MLAGAVLPVPNALSLSPGALLASLLLLHGCVALPLLAGPAPPHLATNTAQKNDPHLVTSGDVGRQAECVRAAVAALTT